MSQLNQTGFDDLNNLNTKVFVWELYSMLVWSMIVTIMLIYIAIDDICIFVL